MASAETSNQVHRVPSMWGGGGGHGAAEESFRGFSGHHSPNNMHMSEMINISTCHIVTKYDTPIISLSETYLTRTKFRDVAILPSKFSIQRFPGSIWTVATNLGNKTNNKLL
jgi:hypothetical protein